MSTDGGGDRVVSTPEETAGVTAFDRGFEWNPAGRPCHPVVYFLEALPYAAGGVAVVVVAALLLTAAGPAIGGAVHATADTVGDFSFDLPGGDEDVEPGVDARTPTATAGPTRTAAGTTTPTATPSPTASPTASPSPSVTPTTVPTSTPTPAGGGTPTATTTATSDPTPTSTPWPDPAHFDVSIDSTNSPVVEGETLTVDATIRNTGDRSDSQTVALDVGGTERDSEGVSLSGGQSTSVTLSWTTGDGDAGDYTATVESYDDSDSQSVTVEHPEPQITQFDVTDESGCLSSIGDASYSISWDTEHTSDSDVTVTLPDGSTESGSSGSTTYSETDGCGDEYTFEIVAENEGGSDSDSVTDTADGSDP